MSWQMLWGCALLQLIESKQNIENDMPSMTHYSWDADNEIFCSFVKNQDLSTICNKMLFLKSK